MRSSSLRVAACTLIAIACSKPDLLPSPPVPNLPVDQPEDAGPPQFPDTGPGVGLRLNRVVPSHGSFLGGNEAILRGSSFEGDVVAGEVEVRFGGRMVQPADIRIEDQSRMEVVVPAGEPGAVDVTVRVRDEEVTLPDGYSYDNFYIEPARGSTAGGTLIQIVGSGTSFQEGDEVRVGLWPCDDVTVISETRMTCRTPAAAVGSVDVSITSAVSSELELADGFEYFDSSDPFSGGLGGGPLDGAINITVVDSITGTPVPEAFVLFGEELETPYQGLTNFMGQVAFSGEDVLPPATITVAKHCFEKASFVAFDARDVTVFLTPWTDPMCGMDGDPPPPGAGRNGSFVSGELVFLGPNEYGPNPWDNIPPEREGWERVSYVYATQPCPGDGRFCVNPDPSLGGSSPRVLETRLGELGYPYRIFVRPSAFAVYALAGLENTTTREFLPYVMGIARNVLAGPGQSIESIDLVMNIPLDHYLDVRLDGLPGPGRNGPDRYIAEADIDLGGEGIIVRRHLGERMDLIQERALERNLRFFAQPALLGELADGRYRLSASWLTGDFEAEPSTTVVRRGVRSFDAEVLMNGFVGIPTATSPSFGQRIPADRLLRWEQSGGVEPTFYFIEMTGGDGNPAWSLFVPGSQTEAPIPDLSTIPDIDDISSGFITWTIYAVHAPEIDYNAISYRALNDDSWTAYAVDVFTTQR